MRSSFVLNLKSEILKCKGTTAYRITLLGAAAIPVVMFLTYIFRADYFVQTLKQTPWSTHILNSWRYSASFLLPIHIILMISLFIQVESRNNTWKQVFATPRRYTDIYISKFFLIQLLIIVYFILFNIFVLLSAVGANLIRPQYNFFADPVNWKLLLMTTWKLYISILAITSIQYFLSLRFQNFIIPLSVGMAALVIGLIIMRAKEIIYYPYAYPTLAFFQNANNKVSPNFGYEIYSVSWFLIFLFGGLVYTIKRKSKG